MIADLVQLMETIEKLLGQSANLLQGDSDDEDSEFGIAANRALTELGLSLPLDNQKMEYWLLSRGKRHGLDVIRISSARKFKYKQIHLDQRFHHFNELIKELDAEFAYATETDADLMNVSGDNAANLIKYIRPGFVYSNEGKDLTYR